MILEIRNSLSKGVKKQSYQSERIKTRDVAAPLGMEFPETTDPNANPARRYTAVVIATTKLCPAPAVATETEPDLFENKRIVTPL